MIRIEPHPEPPDFDQKVRNRGRTWLRNKINLEKRQAPSHWNACRDAVERMFSSRCGYLASYLTSGHVDHFVSWNRCKKTDQHHLAYEWTNLRWIHPQLNSAKSDHELVDPFEVADDWFELDLLSLRLIVHEERIPQARRAAVQRTVEKLQLDDGPIAEKLRREAVDLFREGISMHKLHERAPMVARALERLQDATALDPIRTRLRDELLRARSAARCSAE